MSLGIGGGTSSQSTNSNQNVVSSGGTTATQAKTLTPYQSALQSPLFQTISNLMTNPMQTVAPLVTQAKNNIVNQYKGVSGQLRQQFMGNPGGGQSGKYGTAQLASDLGERSDLSIADVQGAATASQLPLSASNIATQLLGLNFGQTASGSNTGSQNTTGASNSSGSNFSGGLKLGA
jgi:hypothetical protein